jgi:HAMP domain-containing protein
MVWEYRQSFNRLEQRSFEQLKTVKEVKKKEIEWYFLKLREESIFFAQSNLIINAVNDFKLAFKMLDDATSSLTHQQKLQNYYTQHFKDVVNIPNVDSTINKLVPTNNKSILLQNQYLVGTKETFKNIPYFEVHKKYHNAISSFINTYEFYDLLLIEDETGYIIYSVSKEVDFGTSLLSGAFADSNLGHLYRKIRYTGLKNEAMMCDFERYMPSRLAPSAFIAAPIFDGENKIGTLVLQIPLKKLDEITTGKKAWQDEGLGETGESYIVGSDYKMRTDSRFIIEFPQEYLKTLQISQAATSQEIKLMAHYKTTVLFQRINTENVSKALSKLTGTTVITDYRNRKVLSSYAPLNIKDVSWVILAEIDSNEVFESIKKDARQSIFILAIVIILLIIASFLLARTIYKPIRILAEATKVLGKGNLDVRVAVNNKDELGLLGKAFNDAAASLKEQHEQIVTKSKLLHLQKSELMTQSENLQMLNEEIVKINTNLDEKVKERTAKLEQQNNKLVEYTHYNSHRLRAPVATILGLLNVIKISSNETDLHTSLQLLEKATQDLDKVVHDIQKILEEAEFKA